MTKTQPTTAQHVVLKSRPSSALMPVHFEITQTPLPALKPGEFLVCNHILSLDAGFRQWMNAGASDNYLSEMLLDEPVQSIILGQVVDSLNEDYPTGVYVVGRTAWQDYSIADGSDLMSIIDIDSGVPPEQYLSALGPSGMTAYFGLMGIGQPKAKETIVVSAAAGGVGSLVGQMAKTLGCKTIGLTSSEEKCQWLTTELGYDIAINYRSATPLLEQIQQAAPDGVDIYFDNVGGEMLDTVMQHLALNARLVLCGAISQYDADKDTGIYNLWQLVTKRARAEGFMFSDYIDQYPQASQQLAQWINDGLLKAPLNLSYGLETTAQSFCDMLEGKNTGKSLVILKTPR